MRSVKLSCHTNTAPFCINKSSFEAAALKMTAQSGVCTAGVYFTQAVLVVKFTHESITLQVTQQRSQKTLTMH